MSDRSAPVQPMLFCPHHRLPKLLLSRNPYFCPRKRTCKRLKATREVESGDKQVAPPVTGSSHTRKRVERRSHGRPAGDLRSPSDLGPANWGSQTSWCTGEARRDEIAAQPSESGQCALLRRQSRRTKTGHEWIWASRKVKTCH